MTSYCGSGSCWKLVEGKMAARRTFGRGVKIGNWSEDRAEQEVIHRAFNHQQSRIDCQPSVCLRIFCIVLSRQDSLATALVVVVTGG